MQSETVRLPEGWDEFEKVKKILAGKGEARVYFVAVACSGKPGAREARKMAKWITGQGYEVPMSLQRVSMGYSMRNGEDFSPAVMALVKTPEQFAKVWWGLQGIPNSSCGCSIMVTDGQGTDVRVMDTDHVSSGSGLWY